MHSPLAYLHLTSLAGKGRILSVAQNPGEGVPVYLKRYVSGREPLTPTLSPQKSGERETTAAARR